MADLLWQKPGVAVDAEIQRFLAGDDVLLDREFFLHDIEASRAHVVGLARIGLLGAGEAEAIARELDALARDFADGRFVLVGNRNIGGAPASATGWAVDTAAPESMYDRACAAFDGIWAAGSDGNVQVTVQTAFPGTPLYGRLKRERRIIEDEAWEKCTLFDVNFRPTHMSAEELGERFRQLVVPLYSDEATQHRREGFRKMWRGRSRPRRAAA